MSGKIEQLVHTYNAHKKKVKNLSSLLSKVLNRHIYSISILIDSDHNEYYAQFKTLKSFGYTPSNKIIDLMRAEIRELIDAEEQEIEELEKRINE